MIRVVRYPSVAECYTACFGDNKFASGFGGDGKRFKIKRSVWLAKIRRFGCWGFANFKGREIHVWVGRGCKKERVIEMLAHELGHFERPRYRDKGKEEVKAVKYGTAAKTAYLVSEGLFS